MDKDIAARNARLPAGGSPVIDFAARRASAARRAPAAGPFEMSSDENERLLRIIMQSLRVRRHYELFQLLQGEAQFFIPHQMLISAWGDFGSADLKLDVISALPGVRTSRLQGCNVGVQLREQCVRWLANGRQPILLAAGSAEWPAASTCACALHQSLRGMRAMLVHGVHNVRDDFDSLYVAMHSGRILKTGADIDRFRFLADTIVCQIDAAFRRVAALRRHGAAAPRQPALEDDGLSEREIEVLRHVAEGRSNAEIGMLLSISPHTVKNHMKRIMRKLGAANRTAAAAKYRREPRPARA